MFQRNQEFRRPPGQSSFEWLIRLRWLASLGQALTLTIASGWLGLPLSLPPLIAVFLFTAASNLFFSRLPLPYQQRRSTIAFILVLDVFLLTLLLTFSGGPGNPFSILYLLHVVLSAVLLDRLWALTVAGLSIGLFAGLFFWVQPEHSLHHDHEAQMAGLNTHLLGMWVAFSMVAMMTAYCVSRITEELRRREREAERLRLSQKQLASLTTLAAGAAHELSTPLGTIAIAVGELGQSLKKTSPGSPLLQDLELIDSQLTRCKQIISRMSGCSGELAGEAPKTVDLRTFHRSLEEALRTRFQDEIQVRVVESEAKLCLPLDTVTEAVSALAKNALEASNSNENVSLNLSATGSRLQVEVIDHGCGMDEVDLARVGEPFFTTKPEGKGMGLGVFLARLTAESLGGSLRYSSGKGQGTRAEFSLPLIQRTESIGYDERS